MAEGEVRGSCHCGAVTIRVPHPPEWVGSCNCSLCTKTGWLVAYYPDDAVTVEGETIAYVWGDRMISSTIAPRAAAARTGRRWARISARWAYMRGCWMGLMWATWRCG